MQLPIHKTKIGVMGSSQGPTITKEKSNALSRQLGRAIASSGAITLTGACPGLPHEAIIGAKSAGGFTMGISPAFSLAQHVASYHSPSAQLYDVLLFTGMGLMERDIINIRSSSAIIIVGGGIGTLNEFTIAFDEGRIIGVLRGTGGIAEDIPAIVERCGRQLDGRVVFSADPDKLVQKVLEKLASAPPMLVEDERVVGADKDLQRLVAHA